MATGDLRRPGRHQRRQIEEAVERAEAATGLQLCVVLGAPANRDPHEHAEEVFAASRLGERPAVLVLVAPQQHRVEILTSPGSRNRISDAEAAAAVAKMTEAFARGELVAGVLAGVSHLATAAGPGTAPPGQVDLPNTLDADD